MANYILRNIDPTLWRRFIKKCEADGRTLKATLVRFIEQYVKGEIE